MAQRQRFDRPGSWHHLMNRGLSRRAAFEDRACVRYFLACLARVVRAGLLEIHAYSILTTHFHLLARSPTGQLGEAMRLAENRYVRWFNRRVQRDGPLFRGRFRSRLVDTMSYREHLVAYIDHNPVQAGMSPAPEAYPHGSAWHYARASGPKWLTRGWIEQAVRSAAGTPVYDPQSYCSAFQRGDPAATSQLVEARLRSAAKGPDPLDDLLAARPEWVARWLRRKAELADGPRGSLPCAAPSAILRAVEERAADEPGRCLRRGRASLPTWPPMTVGLLRDLAGLRWGELASRTDTSVAAVRRCYETHRSWMDTEEDYRRVAGETAKQSLAG